MKKIWVVGCIGVLVSAAFVSGKKVFCGGFANITCPTVAMCWDEDNFPDAGRWCYQPMWAKFFDKTSNIGSKTGLGAWSDQIIIKFKPGYDIAELTQVEKEARIEGLGREIGVKLTYFRQMSGGNHVLKLPERMSSAEIGEVVEKLKKNDGVESVEEDAIMTPN